MTIQFLSVKILILFMVGMTFSSTIDRNHHASYPIANPVKSTSDKISVRESNYELQVSVGNRIFVFGKAKGTLNKVKVGMHVLLFSQVPDAEGYSSTFNKVSWKKLKDGSIQILSSYTPWPISLSWTVFADGQLKMEASAPPVDFANSRWLGLGFNYPDQSLNQVSWHSLESTIGHWKNQNYSPMADPEFEIEPDSKGLFYPFQTVKLEFEEVSLDVRSETLGTFMGLGHAQNQENSFSQLNSDLVFLFNEPVFSHESVPQRSANSTQVRFSPTPVPLVLWFHFR